MATPNTPSPNPANLTNALSILASAAERGNRQMVALCDMMSQ